MYATMKRPLTIFLLIVIALLVYSNYRTVRQGVTIPTCGAKIIVPLGCGHRVWGNGVEVNCKTSNTIYYCNPLKQASPK